MFVDRDEQLAALEDRLSRRRDYFIKGKERNFDEDDEFWARGLIAWAEEQGLPPLEEARTLVAGLFTDVAKKITTEDAKKIRELVRGAAIRDDRQLSTRELDQVATAATQIREGLAPLRAEYAKATGAKKGAVTKHMGKILDALLSGTELEGDDAALVSGVDLKNLDKVREVGNGLVREVVETAPEGSGPDEIKDFANDLCLKTDGRMQKEDLDALVQWSLKVREMYLDIESRRSDARDASVDAVNRLEQTWQLFKDMDVKQIVSDEMLFRELKDRFGSPYGFGVYFRGGMGAEAIRDLLKDLDLVAEVKNLRETIRTSKGQKQSRAIKRLKVVNAFITSENRPEWMILEAVPVIPPELRPMVQLDGGRFATSDLNDLYRRVINRNNRLKRLLDLGAPEIIVNNEKRMLQEAVDALFDNGRRGRAVTGPGNRALKSLSDMLKGKQGRFRQNLLGKRVDYSGRSVIVAGPTLKLHQCGLPKLMALELFKPFIMSRLVERKSVQNIKAAKKYVDSMAPEVWDVLEEVIAEHPVLLNRAPTLHRLGIQAFEPVLVEGKAIQIHPLVCHAFNADFDGDQMAVHLPLSAEAQAEARILMLSANNILSPAHGKPLSTPTQDMVLGTYYMTYCATDLTDKTGEDLKPRPKRFGTEEEVILAVDARSVDLQDPIEYKRGEELILTTPGRVIFNEEVGRSLARTLGEGYEASEQPFINRALAKKETNDFISDLVDRYSALSIAPILDTIKELGFAHATRAGITISKNDIVIPENKEEILAGYEERVQRIEREYERGLITEDERKERIIEEWTEATDVVADAMQDTMFELNPIYMMANSGARGSIKQIRQLAGMRGLMANPKGEIIERPIKANFMEGLSVLEYFISTHGARKGLADTALRTADSGYLTRRLVDVSQDVIVRDEDCGTDEFIELPLHTSDGFNRSLPGRIVAHDINKPIKDGKPGKTVILAKDSVVTNVELQRLADELGEYAEDYQVAVRSVLRCRSEFGVCKACYGIFLATGGMCEVGDAVGIVAAQSIGEPGTQLTMRTFHTGGVAGADITHGLPRVVEIFEARNPKGAARLAEVTGVVEIEDTDRGPKITIDPKALDENGEPLPVKEYALPRRSRLLVAARRHRRGGRSSARGLDRAGGAARAARDGGQGLHADRALPGRRGAEGLPLAGRRHPRQAHRADHPADAEEGARRERRRHRPAPGPARGQGRARAGERPRQEGQGRAGDVRAADPRDHEGVARNRVVPLGGVVPGDHQGAHGRVDRGQGRPAARPQGERHHREAHPGRHRTQAVPEHRDPPDREGPRRRLHAAGDRGAAPRCPRGDRLERRGSRPGRPRPRLPGRASARRRGDPRGRRGGLLLAITPAGAVGNGRSGRVRSSPGAVDGSGEKRCGLGAAFGGHGLAFSGLLGPEKRLVGALEEGDRVVLARQLRDPGRQVQPLGRPCGFRGNRELEPAVELFGVREGGLGEDDRELVAADAAGDVGAADDRADALGELRQDGVAGQVADALVDRLEVVDVEHDEGELPVVAVRPGDLARERVVEEAPVVEARERVEVGELARLAEAPRVLDRRPDVRRDVLERRQLVVARPAAVLAPEDGHRPDRLVRVVHERQRERAADQAAVRLRALGRVAVGDLDRAGVAAGGRRDRMLGRFLLRHAVGRDHRGLALLRGDHERRVDGSERAGRLERAREHRVEVDGGADRRQLA